MHMEMPLGRDSDFTSLICDLLVSLGPLAQQQDVSFDALSDLNALSDRIHSEVAESNNGG
jgi:hypothetical protein